MLNTYVPIHIHTYYSLLDGLCSPQQIVDRCVELGLPAVGICDHGNLAGIKKFFDAARKKKIKPIIGCELYICENDASIKTKENNKRYHLIVLAKNDQGIKDLMALISQCNHPDYFYRKPRIHLEGIRPFASSKNLIAMSACIAGELPSSLFVDFKEACKISTQTENPNEVRKMLAENWEQIAENIINKHIDIFGKENYYLELQLEGMAIQTVVTECLRKLGEKLGIHTVASLDAHYTRQKEAVDQRLLLYAQMHTTQEEQMKLKEAGSDTMNFFYNDNYHIPSYEEMAELFTQKELQTTLDIANKIEYSGLGNNPCLPIFINDEMGKLGFNSDKYLRYLCIKGGKTKLNKLSAAKKRLYWDHLKKELAILSEVKLSDYFLIEWDACKYVDTHNGPRGKGRGSGAGSIVNYLLNITDIDPLEYGLYFERFYNAARNIPPHFNAGHTDFMEWYGENFEEQMDISVAKNKIRESIKNISNSRLMKQEAEWIDKKNQHMWQYLVAQLEKARQYGPIKDNISNSHLAYGLGICDTLDNNRPVTHIPGHISLPDIDTDIGVAFRAQLIDYLTERWGHDHVVQMITFGRLQGKAALKEVFRAQPDTVKHLMKVNAVKNNENPNDINIRPYDLCNEITQLIPPENTLIDELKEMREETGNDNVGVLHWAIEHIEYISEAYKKFKPLFDQAMRLEGTKRNQSKHAAGLVISDVPIKELVPLAYDPKSGTQICGIEMLDAEKMGAVKFDFLGVGALDKLWFAMDLINQSSKEVKIDETMIGCEK